MRYAPSLSAREVVFDFLVISAAAALVVIAALGSPTAAAYRDGAIAAQAALVPVLLLRRRAPLAVAWLTAFAGTAMTVIELAAPGTLVHMSVDLDRTTPWAPQITPFATYSALAFARNQSAAWFPVTVLTVLVARPWQLSGITATQALLLVLMPALLGLYVTTRNRMLQGLTERAERAEREQHLLAERALAEERTRLAAEMHDVVTHRVSLIVLQAGALGLTTSDQHTHDAAEKIRATGCLALAELADLVAIFHGPEPGHQPPSNNLDQAPVPDLQPLVSESESIGVAVDLTQEGNPSLAAPLTGRTAHRIVQESLTNVRKHAPGARVRIHIWYAPDVTKLLIYNTAPRAAADAALVATGSGAGLSNLRQRVELVGGTLSAGPTPDGGFRVTATLPSLPTPRRARNAA